MRTDKEILKDYYGKPASKIEGKIKEFEIAETGVWLVISSKAAGEKKLSTESMRLSTGSRM